MIYEKLTEKQKRFVDEYIISFNATQSYKNAGYSWKSDNTARTNSSKLLANHNIQEAIKERVELAKDSAGDRIQNVQETLEQDSSVARAVIQVTEYKETDLITGEVIKHTRREYVPSLEEQGRARERIYKVNGAYLDRSESKVEVKTDSLANLITHLKDGD